MNDTEILTLWQAYDKKLDESLQLNRRHAADITKLKVRSYLASMKPIKAFTIVAGLLWVGFVDILIIGLFPVASPFFLVSAGIQVVLTKLAIGVYLYQLIVIHQVDVGEPVVTAQEKIARLKSSTLWVTRLLFLQLPVWTTFYLNKAMLSEGHITLYIAQFVVTVSFTFLAVWLFRNIRYENRNKKWFRLLFEGKEWTPLIKSMDLLSQLEEYGVKNTTNTGR